MSTRQVFILGSPRSGTSALAWALAQHPDMWTSAESDFLLYLFRDGRLKSAWEESTKRPDGGWLQKNRVDYLEFAQYIGTGIDSMFRSRSRGLMWVDQTPGYTLMADILKDLFPFARFIHIVRDGRSVVSSMLSSDFESLGFSMKWTTDFDEACKAWKVYAGRAQKFVNENPDIAMQVRQEDLLVRSQEVMNGVIEFLGLDSNERPAEFLSKKRLNSSYDSGGKTVVDAGEKLTQANKLGPWNKWSNRQQRAFNKIAGEVFLSLGYSMEQE